MAGLIIRTTGVQEFLDDAGEAHVKALILGAPSAGKTRSASFWPKPIFADCEKGRMSIADRHVPYAQIESSADMDAFLRAIEVDAKKPLEQRSYRTLVLDTFDAYQRILVQERLRTERKEALSGFADWGWLDAKMVGLVSRLLRLPMHLVVNVHIKETHDGDDGPIGYQAKLKGDIREQIAAEFDLVGWMNTHWEITTTPSGTEKQLARSIQWHPEPKFPILKDRSGQLPKETPVTFSYDDFDNLSSLMFGDVIGNMAEGQQVAVFEREEPDVVEPTAGGPVRPTGALPAKSTAKRAAPKQEPAARTMKAPSSTTVVGTAPDEQPATEPASEPEATPEPGAQDAPAPEVSSEAATDVPTADTPSSSDAAAQAEPEAGVAVAQEVLGAEVVSTEQGTDEQNEKEDTPAPTPPQPETPAPAAPTATCGTPSRHLPEGTPPASGCGKSLAGENKDLINIAILKSKTLLCPACLTAWRAEHEKKAS